MTDGVAYLDHNATSPLRPEARAAVVLALDTVGNPSSVHGAGRAARRLVEESRTRVAALAGAMPAEVVFTGGGTEANAMALRGTPRRAVVSAVEHPSVLENAPGAAVIPVDEQGLVDLEALNDALGDGAPAVVSVMAANNETGVVMPIEAVSEVARRHGALVHVDAVQLAGKGDLTAIWAVADLLTLSAHKLGGPSGAGALLVRSGIGLSPLVAGGGQERGQRAGTENLCGIAGFGAAAAAAAWHAEAPRIAELRDQLEDGVRQASAGAIVVGAGAPRLPNTACIALPGTPAETQVMALDLAGIAVSAGSACSSGKVQRSHVLAAMGLDDAAASSAIRVSLGWNSSRKDVDLFLAAWADMCARRRAA
jgi:cysteine desulfurase